MSTAISSSETRSRTLVRGLEILRLFGSDRQALRQREIAELLELPLPTIGRLCSALVETGFLTADDRSRVLSLGPEIRRLGDATSARDVKEDVRSWMRALNGHFDETINLSILDGTHTLYLDTVACSRVLGPQTVIGSRAPAHCTAAGKSLLATLDDTIILDRLGRGPYERRTSTTIQTWPELKAELDAIRTGGVSRSVGEFEDGLSGYAVVLDSYHGPSRVALSIAVPTVRVTPERAEQFQRALLTHNTH
ncbi:MAG: IclR family transcriptional regulator [Pseudonocardiaceae bacterium]